MSKPENFIAVPMGTVGISLVIPRLVCLSDTNLIALQAARYRISRSEPFSAGLGQGPEKQELLRLIGTLVTESSKA